MSPGWPIGAASSAKASGSRFPLQMAALSGFAATSPTRGNDRNYVGYIGRHFDIPSSVMAGSCSRDEDQQL
jgi:hypothetical protein